MRTAAPEPSTVAVDTSLAADTVIGDCAVALHPPRDQERPVIDALKAAYGLERNLYKRADSVTSWDQVYSYYRRGFSEELARDLADYSWQPEFRDAACDGSCDRGSGFSRGAAAREQRGTGRLDSSQ